jgi:biotin transport system substrate-specific component
MPHDTIGSSRAGIARTVFTALFAALIAAGTFIAIPIPLSPVPLVLQNFFALLAGLVLGPVLGLGAALLYLLVGAIGAPVFAGAKGGIAHMLGPTGGYLLGYALCALAAGLVAGKPTGNGSVRIGRIILAAAVGLLAVYVPGVLRLKMALDADWPKALTIGLLPFLPGDGIKAVLAILLAPRLRRIAADRLDG